MTNFLFYIQHPKFNQPEEIKNMHLYLFRLKRIWTSGDLTPLSVPPSLSSAEASLDASLSSGTRGKFATCFLGVHPFTSSASLKGIFFLQEVFGKVLGTTNLNQIPILKTKNYHPLDKHYFLPI